VATVPTVEDIILKNDRRGISVLRSHVPADYCTRAAKLIMESLRNVHPTVIITTGFYILSGKAAETDGPPGAIALGNTLHKLGFEVAYLTDKYALPFFTPEVVEKKEVVEFPITGDTESRVFADKLLMELRPSLLISTERSGPAANGKYFNMYSRNIGENTAKIDLLFDGKVPSIGIGDGGNEIGMGNLAAEIKTYPNLTRDPAVTKVTELIIASVSNWGAYGLIAAISIKEQRNLLPEVTWEKEFIGKIVRLGAVDGVSGVNRLLVDGFDPDENARTLIDLNEFVNSRIA
jgi:hypothetical protein